MWSLKQASRVQELKDGELPETLAALLLDKDKVSSVRDAVAKLSSGEIEVANGYCLVFSATQQAYHMLWKEGRREIALARVRPFGAASDGRLSTSSLMQVKSIINGSSFGARPRRRTTCGSDNRIASPVGSRRGDGWSAKQAVRVCNEGEEGRFNGKAQLLDVGSISSVAQAIPALNRGDIQCPDGYCVAYSASRQAYYLLYQRGLRETALGQLGIVDGTTSPVAGSPAPQSGRRLLKQDSSTAIISPFPTMAEPQGPWSTKLVQRLCAVGEEGVFKDRVFMLDVADASSVKDAVQKLNGAQLACGADCCAVFSASQQAYFLLYKQGSKPTVLAENGRNGNEKSVSSDRKSVVADEKLAGADELWSLKQVVRLCADGEEQRFEGKASLLGKDMTSSIGDAIKKLCQKEVQCDEGFCVAYSSRQSAYYLLYRRDAKEAAFEKLGLS